MKRRSQSKFNQPPLKKSEISNPTEPLRTKIATKLQSLFDGFVSDLQTIPKEEEPDLTLKFDTQHASNFIKNDHNVNNPSDSEQGFKDDSTIILQNFINSAKSRFSGLLKQEQEFQEIQDLLETTLESCPQANVRSTKAHPLQIQISLKVQSLLCKPLESKKSIANGKSRPSVDVSEVELQDLSHMLQNFMNFAKQKLSRSLSEGHSKHQFLSIQSENGSLGSSSPRTQSRNVPQVSHCSHKCFHSSRLHSIPPCCSKGEFIKPIAVHCKLGKENLSTLQSDLKRTTPSVHSPKMYSPHLSDSDSFESSTLCIPKTKLGCNSYGNGNGGMIFLEDSERAPEYLDLELNTDVEDQAASDSEEEVIVLGEKRPTYEEITLEEDDENEVLDEEKEVEELLFNCPKCEKVFRVESLLKFHVRMHGAEETPVASASEGSMEKRSLNSDDESSSTKSPKIFESSSRKEKENKTKSKSKRSSHRHKLCGEKRLKYDKKRNISKHS